MKNKDRKTEMTAMVMRCAVEMLRCYKETRETCTFDGKTGGVKLFRRSGWRTWYTVFVVFGLSAPYNVSLICQ